MLQAGLRLPKDKCEFMSASVVYLGHHIDAQGLYPTTDKVAAISLLLYHRTVLSYGHIWVC